MTIYHVYTDINNFQGFLPSDLDVWRTGRLLFDCSPKLPDWEPPAVYIPKPKLRRGNFLDIAPGTFVIDSTAYDLTLDLLEMSGELLDLPFSGEALHVLNITECIDVLDDNNTEWEYGQTTGAKIRIMNYAFHRNRLTETPLFKIPQTCRADIYTVEGWKDPQDEFKHRVDAHGLTGLVFEPVWSDGE